jgi:RNA polymerase sigma factor (sigma-70 family)
MSSLSSAAAPAQADRGPHLRLSHLGDELLARYAARGNERAFAAIYERYHQPLYRYCRSILRNEIDAQDALQSTFVGALQALRREQRSAPLRPWLYRIAHNESISLLRRRSRDASDELDAQTLGVGASVEQEVAERARWRSLVEDLSSLPDRQRGALLLRELNGLSHEEIAIALGTSIAAAKQSIFEARQALAEIAEGRAMSCEEIRQRISEGDRRVLRGRRVTAHLRHCAGCEAFALAIPDRRAQLRAFTPVLPSATAAALLAHSLHAASSHGGFSGASAAATAGAAGKAAGTALTWKALAGVALLASTAAGVTGVSHLLTAHHPATHAAPAAVHHATTQTHAGAVRGAHGATRASAHSRSARHTTAAHTRVAHHGARVHHSAAAVHHKAAGGPSTASNTSSTSHGSSAAHSHGSTGRSSSAPGHGSTPPGHSSTPRGRSSNPPGHHTRTHHHLRIHLPRVHVSHPLHLKATVKKSLTQVTAGRSPSVRTHTPSR